MDPLKRRVVSLLMIRVDARYWGEPDYRDRINRCIDLGVGGIGIFLGGLEETAEMIAGLQRRAGNRLLVAGDFEFGLPMRLDGGVAYPRAMALGKTDVQTTEAVAAAIAKEVRAIGIHWNWAPCADINSNSKNPIINIRSFGEQPELVAAHSVAFVNGLQSSGVIACAKHVPGHGDTHVDSHLDLPRIEISEGTAQRREFLPFIGCIEADVKSLMIGHIIIPFLDPTNPASLSHSVMTDLVRNKWGFRGLVTTDALDMQAITNHYSTAEVAVRAVNAGADIVLMPLETQASIKALQHAVDDGIINEERVMQAEEHRRFAESVLKKNSDASIVDQPAHALLALRAADKAISLEGNQSLLPLVQFKHVGVFAVIDEKESDTATTFFRYLAEATEMNIDFGYIDGTIEERDLAGLNEGVHNAECIVFVFFTTAVAFRNSIPGFEYVPGVMNRLSENKKRIVIACGSPYGISELSADLRINTFSDTIPSIAALVLRLIGRIPG